jgi:hypothetical protein
MSSQERITAAVELLEQSGLRSAVLWWTPSKALAIRT